MELAVKNAIEGNEIKNKEALANPEILDQYKNLKKHILIDIQIYGTMETMLK